MTFEWVYTPSRYADVEVGWTGDTVTTIVEVCRDERSEQYVVGLTDYRTPKDYDFKPRDFFPTGDLGLAMATRRADTWAAELAYDETR